MGVVLFHFCFSVVGETGSSGHIPRYSMSCFFCPFFFRADVTTIYSAFRKRKGNKKFVSSFVYFWGKHMLCPACRNKTEGACMLVFPPFSKPLSGLFRSALGKYFSAFETWETGVRVHIFFARRAISAEVWARHVFGT